MTPSRLACALLVAAATCSGNAAAWGHRAHAAIDTAAVQALPDDGPVFLKRYAQVIADGATLPDGWRSESEPFLKIDEDPNHGWFREQFAFMQHPPRSRYAFVLALYDEQRRIAQRDPQLAQRMNVRWAGTLPYAATEGYERIVATMRQLRTLRAKGQDTGELERTCAFHVSWFAHYIGDGAQPQHDSIHHDGWQGPNPNGYSTDPKVHGKFESDYVEKIALTPQDLLTRMPTVAHQQGDVFEQILDFPAIGTGRVEQVYRLEKAGAFDDASSTDGRAMVYRTAGDGAAMLRDLLVRAWRESALQPEKSTRPRSMDPSHPQYDPATGSAPAGRSPTA
ncbi:nuclease [Xanthomonas bromi]|uniref:Nuclease n=1 Tax=Xanthomonas bromi TaxID=56449 RepID=A0A1C3NQA5_9XANT|nr:nuclease [Xanthomonas bromi]PPV05449.1 nuclease [Xanthomonas bromi]SBV52590.1 nuclease [Xanthomonas bromi]